MSQPLDCPLSKGRYTSSQHAAADVLVEGWDDAADMDEGWSSDGDEAVSFHDEDDDDFSIDIEDS